MLGSRHPTGSPRPPFCTTRNKVRCVLVSLAARLIKPRVHWRSYHDLAPSGDHSLASYRKLNEKTLPQLIVSLVYIWGDSLKCGP